MSKAASFPPEPGQRVRIYGTDGGLLHDVVVADVIAEKDECGAPTGAYTIVPEVAGE